MHFHPENEIKNPYHLEKPAFHATKASLNWNNQPIDFYLDINAKEKIVGAYYVVSKVNDWLPHLSALCRWLENKNINFINFEEFLEDTEYAYNEFIYVPHALFAQALVNFRGATFPHQLLKQSADSLVCRCFGVYEQQIVSLVQVNANVDLKGVTDEILAGGGCTSCSNDIVGIISSTKDFYGLETTQSNPKIKGIYPAQMILLLDSLLKEYGEGIEIISLEGYQLSLKSQNSIDENDLQQFLKEKLSVGFKLNF